MKYSKIVQLRETDAAGVVYFANLLSICHDAYEASIRAHGIDMKTFFNNSQVAVPIVHAEINFKRPIFCGDEIEVNLVASLVSENEFSINYQILAVPNQSSHLAKAKTIHVCINPNTRKRQPLPESLLSWMREKFIVN